MNVAFAIGCLLEGWGGGHLLHSENISLILSCGFSELVSLCVVFIAEKLQIPVQYEGM